jgi:hypothetical protein
MSLLTTATTSITHIPSFVKTLAYERVYHQFEKPNDALGNRYRNPLARLYDPILNFFRKAARTLERVEITVRLRPY